MAPVPLRRSLPFGKNGHKLPGFCHSKMFAVLIVEFQGVAGASLGRYGK